MLSVDKGACQGLVGDPLRLGQVLLNLIGNAVKFTEKGEVVVSVQAQERGEGWVTLKFSVRDTGIGMSPEQQQRVFAPFVQTDSSITRRYGGTGLGLAISKRLVALMGGEIWVESALGQGSTFTFTVRLKIGREKPLSCEAQGVRVLVVDDNKSTRDILRAMLESYGFSVDTAESGQQCMEKMASQRVDLVLLDWKMPGMDGTETAKRICALEEPPKVIFITAYRHEDMVPSLKGLPIAGYLLKPVVPSLLIDAVMGALGKQRALGHAFIVGKTPKELPFFENVKALVVEDNEINLEVSREMLHRLGIETKAASNGQEALETLKANAFDVVFMDVQMPVMDGYATTMAIRKDERFRDLPVIAMTANAMADDRQRCLDAGMNDYIPKPINLETMGRVLSRWLKAKEEAPERKPPPETFHDQEAFFPEGVDAEAAVSILGGDRVFYRRLLWQFSESFATFGSRLRQSLTQGRREAAKMEVHTLKGAAGNLRVMGVWRAAGRLQEALGKDEPMEAMEPILAEIELVLGEIARWAQETAPEGPETMPMQGKFDKSTVAAALHELYAQLNASDTEAIETIERLEDLLPLAPAIKNLSDKVRNYDFEGAMDALESLGRYLGIQVTLEGP